MPQQNNWLNAQELIAKANPQCFDATPHHIKLQLIGQKYINLLLSTLYPLHNEQHPDNGHVFKHVNLTRKTHAIIKYDRIVTGRINGHQQMGDHLL